MLRCAFSAFTRFWTRYGDALLIRGPHLHRLWVVQTSQV
jgi:hypothetical protein